MNRFCGMCGTPLPQKPITAPGAQSTLSFTRVPIDGPRPSSSASPSEANSAVVEAPRKRDRSLLNSSAPSPASGASATTAPTVAEAFVAEPEVASSPAGTNYFTQAEEAESLEQFIAGFHYKPPAEEDELTMTGDRPVPGSGKHVGTVASSALAEEPAAVVEAPAAIEAQPEQEAPYVESQVVEPPPFALKNVPAESPDRSRFLDLAETAPPEIPAEPAASIGGPSFLGLSDTPGFPQDVTPETAPRSHWRAWLALFVVLIFAGLGYLEWRAEKNQSSSGPMGVMKMQIDRLKGKKAVATPVPTAAAPETAPASAQPSGSGPDIQIVPGQKPQTTSPAPATQPAAGPDKPANPGTSSTTPSAAPMTEVNPPATAETSTRTAQNSTGAPVSSPAASPAKSSATETVNKPPAAASSTEGAEVAQQSPNAKAGPGAEELARAQKASDAEAASAWLWKAVAKGNPVAPVQLANMYITGAGVPQNCEQALVLLRSAAAKDNAAADSRLGSMYANGTCVPRDRVRAYKYMSSAVEANPRAAWARDFREQLWEHMTPQERSQAQKSR